MCNILGKQFTYRAHFKPFSGMTVREAMQIANERVRLCREHTDKQPNPHISRGFSRQQCYSWRRQYRKFRRDWPHVQMRLGDFEQITAYHTAEGE